MYKKERNIIHLVVVITSFLVFFVELFIKFLYKFLLGKDATRAFVTGDFSEDGLVDNVDGLSEQELLGILDWVKFYEKDYEVVGVVDGAYYDAEGEPTKLLTEVS